MTKPIISAKGASMYNVHGDLHLSCSNTLNPSFLEILLKCFRYGRKVREGPAPFHEPKSQHIQGP